MPDRENPAERLGKRPVGELLLTFSIPAVSGMLVTALYNAVDRVFVGRGVDEAALAGLSLVLPLVTVSMAFAMLFGIGAANMISLRLGQRKKAEAEEALNQGFRLLLVAGVVVALIEYPLLDTLLPLFGAPEDGRAIGYARDYYRILLYGHPFFLVGFGMSHCARAQGFPMISMIGMFIGAGLNTALDPLFIFVFGWGVKGAAWATVISQGASMAWILAFSAGRRGVIRLRPFEGAFSWRVTRAVMAFGSSQFLLQFAMSAVQLLLNKSMMRHGAAALGRADGGETALAAMNITGTFLMLFLMPVFGINQGAQPVLGYNYGARRFDRVRKAYMGATAAATAICAAGFLWAQLFPMSVARLFAPAGSPELLRFTRDSLRLALLILPLAGFQIVSTNMFVVTGRPKTAILLSLMRQCVAIIPAIFIFGRLWGLYGVIAAMPFADAVSVVLTAVLIRRELKKLRDRPDVPI